MYLCALIAMLAVAFSGAAHAQTEDYVEITLATHADKPGAVSLNDLGQAVGALETAAGDVAMVWDENSAVELPVVPGSSGALAWSINNLGQIVGSVVISRRNHIVLWENPGDGWNVSDLGTGVAFAINDTGVIAAAVAPIGVPALLLNGSWSPLSGGLPFGLNNATPLTVVGRAGPNPIRWVDGATAQLPTLGGNWGLAYRVNDAGQIVGQSRGASGQGLPVTWEAGAIRQLPLPSGLDSAFAHGINEAGEMVGTAGRGSVDGRPLLWRDGAVTDLSVFGDGESGICCGAYDIDEFGQVVGSTAHSITIWRPALAAQRIENLRRVVERLGTLPGNPRRRAARGGSTAGNVRALLAKLDAAENALDRGNDHAAQGALLAFVNQVQAFMKTGKLTAAQGNPLAQQASSIWDQLNEQ